MFHARKIVSFSVAAALLLVLAAGIAWALRQHSRKTLRLADGRQFVLRDATFGTNHVYHYGALFPRLASPLLTAKLKRRFGLYDLERQTPIPALMLWGHWSGVKSNFPPNVLTLLDSTGVESEQSLGSPLPSPKQQAEPEYAWKCLNYPRREKNLHVRVYEYRNYDEPEFRGDLIVPNPAPGPFPQWSAGMLPIGVTNGSLTCTLLGLKESEMPLRSYNPRRPKIIPAHTAVFKVTRQGVAAPEWEPSRLQITDATGNLLEPLHVISEQLGDNIGYTFSGALWPSEHAWKLKMELIKKDRFESNELWSVGNVPIPTTPSPLQIATNAEVQGAIISILTINGVLRFPQIGGFARQNAEVTLLVSTPEAGVNVRLVKVSDQDDHPVRFGSISVDPAAWRFPLEIPAGARSLNFQFAIQKPWTVEFITGLQGSEKRGTTKR